MGEELDQGEVKPLVHGSLAPLWQEETGIMPRREGGGESQQVSTSLVDWLRVFSEVQRKLAQGLMDRGRRGTERQPGG